MASSQLLQPEPMPYGTALEAGAVTTLRLRRRYGDDDGDSERDAADHEAHRSGCWELLLLRD